MNLLFFIFLPLFAVGESQPTNQMNQTELQEAMANMRTKSYHGFVIILKILSSDPNALHNGDITFLMPNDEQLSKAALNLEHLQDFILSHSIPTALLLSNLLNFPTGTLVPSSIPSKMIDITNNGKTSLFVNNARIVGPNVCEGSVIRCHGINATLTFDNSRTASAPAALPPHLHALAVEDSPNKYSRAKSLSSINLKSAPLLH